MWNQRNTLSNGKVRRMVPIMPVIGTDQADTTVASGDLRVVQVLTEESQDLLLTASDSEGINWTEI